GSTGDPRGRAPCRRQAAAPPAVARQAPPLGLLALGRSRYLLHCRWRRLEARRLHLLAFRWTERAVSYVRVSLMRARNGEEQRVHDLLDRLITYYAEQQGYVTGYRLEPTEPEGYIGRIGVWESAEDADRAAQTEHDLAL